MTDEQFEWNAESGVVELSTGEKVAVQGGDILLGEDTSDGIVFHEVQKVTRH